MKSAEQSREEEIASAAKERREEKRTPSGIPARVIAPRPSPGIILDLSRAGMLLELERRPLFRKGSEIHVTFKLPGYDEELRTRAAVIRHHQRIAMGLRFVMLSMDEVNAIGRYYESLTTFATPPLTGK